MIFDNANAGYTRLDDDSSWVYNTGENGIFVYSGSQGNVASTTGSDCKTWIHSRTVADGSEAFYCQDLVNISIACLNEILIV